MHKEVMMTYCFESRHQSALGGQSPEEVVLTNQYIPLSIAENKEMEGDGTRSPNTLENTLRRVLLRNRDQTRVVMILGPAGVGKTTTMQKMLLDWAGRKVLEEFDFIFPFAFRDLILLEQEMSLEDFILMQHGHFTSESLAVILQSPQSLLFMFDGLEQYQYRLQSTSDSALCTKPNQPVPVPVLFTSLVKGGLLKGASILITARSTASLSFLSDIEYNHVQILGFSPPQRKAYFDQVFTDPKNAEKAFQYVEQKMGFYDLCGHPIFCWIMCFLLKERLETGDDLPETLTQVYVQTSASIFRAHDLEEGRARDLVLGLGKMATHSLSNSQLLSQKDLADSGLQQFLMSPLLSAFLFLHGDPASDNCMFSFISPIVQEFFIALLYYLDITWSGGESVEELLGKLEGSVKFLDVFLSGLSDAEQRKPLEGIVGEFSKDRIEGLREWLKNTTVQSLQFLSYKRPLSYYRLLHQSQNPALVKEISDSLAAGLGRYYSELSAWDSAALNYVVVCCGGRDELHLHSSVSLTGEMTLHLIPAFRLSRKLILFQCTLSTASYVHLASVIREGRTVELDLSYNRAMGDSGAKALFGGLRDCSLQILRLPVCGLRAACCEDLASVLAQPATQLHVLDLRSNELQDEGLIQLCGGLRSPHCKLQELRLQDSGLTHLSMEVLSQAISDESSTLATLVLDGNEVSDLGMDWLTRVLRSSKTSLQHLSAFDCNLTDACCEGLAVALLSEGCSLTELNLSLNDLGDSGVLQLCEPLKFQGCSLEKLRLVNCQLSEVSFRELGGVLRSGNSRLTALDVGLNKVGNTGAKYLWQALADNHCQLEHLDMEMINLTDGSLEDISAALKANTSLKTLVLKNNILTDASVPSLVQLINESRTIQKINLQYNDFSEDVFEIFETCGRVKY
ncbi:NACHT, LRR and PYD domains-containing protein 3 isoform X2 [Brienomyrus brachyistius]|nr:NACHT, LRR and PYD domains-containing protein 3 isoform X2 [Brienomyrus brachyistius]XP_048873157.1 NACHT, LRR and PYD domains-containing protein 3 isoform X2 [Brienomyrus brachyistius]XP_048873158.1 NACHT, LRR and PYD domains-containing protein 3 isoform X2 [Brienomyrus brachyistius]